MTHKRALIVKLGQIGDVIMAIPSAAALHERGFEIYWVCGNSVASLLSCYSWVTLIPVDERGILLGGGYRRFRHIINLWTKIARREYDICATLYYDRRYRVLTLPVRAKQRLMLSRRSRATTLIAGRHHTDEYLRVLLQQSDGYKEQSSSPVRPDRLPRSPLPEKKAARRIVIVPGGVRSLVREEASGHLRDQLLRRWPVENYVTLARLFLDRGWEVVLLGAKEDVWVKPYFEDLECTDCLGTMSLAEVVSACDACDAVISHDTGPLHLAGLSTACLVGIFGPTDPATRVPRRPHVIGIWGGQGFACRPCYDGQGFAPCEFNGCIRQVSPEFAIRELDQLLSDRSRGMAGPWRVISTDGTDVGTPVRSD